MQKDTSTRAGRLKQIQAMRNAAAKALKEAVKNRDFDTASRAAGILAYLAPKGKEQEIRQRLNTVLYGLLQQPGIAFQLDEQDNTPQHEWDKREAEFANWPGPSPRMSMSMAASYNKAIKAAAGDTSKQAQIKTAAAAAMAGQTPKPIYGPDLTSANGRAALQDSRKKINTEKLANILEVAGQVVGAGTSIAANTIRANSAKDTSPPGGNNIPIIDPNARGASSPEEEKKRKTRRNWIIAGSVGGGLIIVALILWFVFRKKAK